MKYILLYTLTFFSPADNYMHTEVYQWERADLQECRREAKELSHSGWDENTFTSVEVTCDSKDETFGRRGDAWYALKDGAK